MSKYSFIEKELSLMNDARFQVVGNAFLRKEYEGAIHSPGMAVGKEKTRKGRPDSFVFRKDGKFLLAEYTTKDKELDKEQFYKKLEKDLLNCLDFESLCIQASDVSEIVLCCNSDVGTSEIARLKKHTNQYDIPLSVIGIRTLTLHFLYKDRYFAHEFLNVPFDTGQILSKAEFLKQYSKRNFSTPLDNELIGREKELTLLKEAIAANAITIVKGPPGVGKSRLVLEAIDRYVEENSGVIPYYFIRKGGGLTEDLLSLIEDSHKLIFFIDDANRQADNFLEAINAQLDKERGQIKIVVTVRDYAREDVARLCRQLNPFFFSVDRLSDETIKAILDGKDFNVKETALADRIVEISKGNPRLAIMAARIIKKSPDLNLLKDVSHIYDEYFQTIIDDKELFSDVKTLKVLGVLSFLNSIDLEDENEKAIIDFFGFSYAEFVEVVDKLEDMEIVEVYMEYTVKMSEQVMSTYFFYKAFFKDRLFKFSNLLTTYFSRYPGRMQDSFDPANAAFGESKVLNIVKEEIIRYYNRIRSDDQQTIVFFRVFGKYLPNLTLDFLNGKISALPDASGLEDEVKKGKRSSSNFDFGNVLELLDLFYKTNDLSELSLAVDLSVIYLQKEPFLFNTVLKTLGEHLQVTETDLANVFLRQRRVYDDFRKRMYTQKIYELVFYDLFATVLLNRHYEPVFYVKSGEKWQLTPSLKTFREDFWQELTNNYSVHKDAVIDTIMAYREVVRYGRAELFGDIPFIKELFDRCLDPSRFEDCYIVQEYIQVAEERGISNMDIERLDAKFTNESYQVFSHLTWKGLDHHELLKQLGRWEEVERYKEEVLKQELQISNRQDYDFIERCIGEIVSSRFNDQFNLAHGMDLLLGGLIERDPDFGLDILSAYLKNGNLTRMFPGKILKAVFMQESGCHLRFFQMVSETKFSRSDTWIERYFYFLPERFVDQVQVDRLIRFYRERKAGVELVNHSLDKFLSIEPKVYEIVLQNEVQKRKEDQGYSYKLDYQFFKTNPSLTKANYPLCLEAYLQQEAMAQRRDSEMVDFFALFESDRSILYKHIDYLHQHSQHSFFSTGYQRLTGLWEYPDAEEIIYGALVKIRSMPGYYVSSHLATVFFVQLDKRFHERAYELLARLLFEFKEDKKMIDMALDIGRNCLKEFYQKLIQYFVTINDDFELFSELQFCNNHFSSSGDAIWADFKAMELRKIYFAIKELPDRKFYLRHLGYLEQEISLEEKDSVRERKLRFRGFR